jgi:hypothetical protein
MLKATLSDGTAIFGLSDMNIEKLREGLPIVFDGKPFGFPGRVIIVYGKTEQAIADYIMRETGQQGATQ